MAELTTFEDTMAQLRQEMIGPLTRQRDEANQRIDELQQELDSVRAVRRDAERMLKALDPAAKPGPRKSPGNTQNGFANKGAPVTPELLDAALAFLRTVKFPDGFSQTQADQAYRESGSRPKISSATWRNVIGALHDSGAIRYDRRGKRGGKIYKVVGK